MICFIICVFPFRSFPSSLQVFSVIKKAHEEAGDGLHSLYLICNPYTLGCSSVGSSI